MIIPSTQDVNCKHGMNATMRMQSNDQNITAIIINNNKHRPNSPNQQTGQERTNTNLGTDKATKSKSGECASVSAKLIQVSNVNLNRCMILRGDEPVSSGTATTNYK